MVFAHAIACSFMVAGCASPKEAETLAARKRDDFDRQAVLSALQAAATAAQSCRTPDGPTGEGRIAVVFAGNGKVTSATVESSPYAGTPVGDCIENRFLRVRIPPFSGTPITVHKSFVYR
jgi:hypothetical protein